MTVGSGCEMHGYVLVNSKVSSLPESISMPGATNSRSGSQNYFQSKLLQIDTACFSREK